MFLAAYLFHHTYNGDSLDPGQVSSATCFAREHGVEGTAITHFLAQNGPFPKALFQQNVTRASTPWHYRQGFAITQFFFSIYLLAV